MFKTLLAGSLALTAGLVCPATKEHLESAMRVRMDGEPCGGECGGEGLCMDGSTCVQPKGASDSPGTCSKIVEDMPGRKLVGGSSDADLESEALGAAAKWAHSAIMSSSNAIHPPAIKRIVSATHQVVAGTKWNIVLETVDGAQHRIELVDAPWLTPRYTLIKHDVL